MANHDNYEKNLLKALQDIAKSLRSIDSTLKTVDKEKEKTENVHSYKNYHPNLEKQMEGSDE